VCYPLVKTGGLFGETSPAPLSTHSAALNLIDATVSAVHTFAPPLESILLPPTATLVVSR
jgi:hypothetical protein